MVHSDERGKQMGSLCVLEPGYSCTGLEKEIRRGNNQDHLVVLASEDIRGCMALLSKDIAANVAEADFSMRIKQPARRTLK
jgi:hypothetical protein